MSPSSGDSSGTMVVRVSPDDFVLYVNESLANYLRISKVSLMGAPLAALASRARGEVAHCFQRPEGGRRSTNLVTDADGRVFEVKVRSEGGVMDIVFDEVTTAESICRDLRSVSGTSVDVLNEEELRTARTPERRFMTVSLSRLNGVTHLAGRLEPLEIQLMVNSFVEEVSDAVLETGCTAIPISGEAVAGIFGAPRYFADHPLRAIHAACSQIEKTARLTAGFSRQGKEMPPMSCGIWTGEAFVGTLGNSKTRHYSAIGQPVDFAAELCRLARPGEVLVSDTTLQGLIKSLPDGWNAIKAESQADPDLGDFHWEGHGVEPLSQKLVRRIWLIGPGIELDTSNVEFYLEYLWALRVSEVEVPVPILRVVRPTGSGRSIELSDNNVVSSQFVQTLGKYKLISVIGTGGMGKVWKALDRYGNIVAIKVLHAGESISEAQIKRFHREAEIMARLPHRNICRVLEMNEFEGIQYLVMEFVDGLTLSELLTDDSPVPARVGQNVHIDIQQLIAAVRYEKGRRRGGPGDSPEGPSQRVRKSRIIPVEQALNLFLKICDAVQFAHEHGVLHRDLKPGNILLREDGEPLVADFGLAKFDPGDGGASISVSGHVVGTLENMAPEQAESSKDVDERADLYSLGTILYQMLTGHRHFEATGNIVTDGQALQAHEPPRLRSLNPKIDSDLEIIVLKCLRNSPVHRYRSAAALKADLNRYIRGEAISARPVSNLELVRKLVMRNRTVSTVIAVSLLVLASSSALAFWKVTERMAAAERSADEARQQREIARANEELAKKSQEEATKNLEIAKAQIEKANRAEADASKAKELLSTAVDQSDSAKLAAEAAKNKLEEEKKKFNQLEERLISQSRVPDPPTERLQDPVDPPSELEVVAEEQVNRGLDDAIKAYREELKRDRIPTRQRNIEPFLANLNNGINNVSKALLADSNSVAAWVMKGRFHLSCMELKQAKDSFDMAINASGRKSLKRTQLDVECEKLREICAKLSSVPSSNDRFVEGAKLLVAPGTSAGDHDVAKLLVYLKDKTFAYKTITSPVGRGQTPAESALNIIMDANGTGRIVFTDAGRNGKDLVISGIPKLAKLNLLDSLSPTSIRIYGAETIDIQPLARLPSLESLDLGGCPITQLGPSTPNFRRLKTLSLRDTKITDLSPLRNMTTLETLDLSGLPLVNVVPLFDLRSLSKLTVSPEKFPDKMILIPLKQLTLNHLQKLKVLRAPDDPENQPPTQFWQNFFDKRSRKSQAL